MNKRIKIWLITAAALVAAGVIVFAAAMTAHGWDFNKLSTVKYQSNTYELNEVFGSITIDTDTADITLIKTDEEKCKVVCNESEKVKYSASVDNGKLIIKETDERKWYEYIGINVKSPVITVYLPNTEYDRLTIKNGTGDVKISEDFKLETVNISTSTGDISLKNAEAESIELSVSTGKITLTDVNCKGNVKLKSSTGKTKITSLKCENLTSQGNTGDISLNNVIATEIMSVSRSTGDVKLEKCDAAEISINTNTGDVKGTVLTEKVFETKSSTGDIHVPKTANGGKCEITTSTGDIEIDIAH